MVRHKLRDEIMEQINQLLPDALKQFPEEIRKNLHPLLESIFAKFDLLTHKEFTAQKKVLERTRKQLEELEQRVATLEKKSHKKTKSK